jgi:hypothetical protein
MGVQESCLAQLGPKSFSENVLLNYSNATGMGNVSSEPRKEVCGRDCNWVSRVGKGGRLHR